jgi:hypothetical protein
MFSAAQGFTPLFPCAAFLCKKKSALVEARIFKIRVAEFRR